MVTEIITQHRDEIAALCRKYRVRRLYLFGSATGDEFDLETSDFDFLVELGEYEPGVAYRYLNFADALEVLLGRRVDLVTARGLTRPRFREEVEATRVLLYETTDDQAAA